MYVENTVTRVTPLTSTLVLKHFVCDNVYNIIIKELGAIYGDVKAYTH